MQQVFLTPLKSRPKNVVYPPVVCPECQTTFVSNRPNAKWCSPACSNAVNKRKKQAYMAAYYQRRKQEGRLQ